MTFLEQYNNYVSYFNNKLDNYIDNYVKDLPNVLGESISYAIKDGGKRIRPCLLLALSDIFNLDKENVISFAIAIECIHSYSLVHDDLPAMDNDDYRRGKFSTHKKFGEANGILAGDALLNLAFETILKTNLDEKGVKALYILSDYAGAKGMIKGQVLDLAYEKNPVNDINVALEIYENKTSKLLTAPLLIASILADNKYFDDLKDLGYNLGVLFQITDDILDVEGDFNLVGKTLHKDDHKLTFINLVGLEKAKEYAKNYYDKCLLSIKNIQNNQFLIDFINYIYYRKR